MHKGTVIIGLTGATGAGKSTFAAAFKKLGCHIIDCDRIAREIILQKDCITALQQEFGNDIVQDGRIDRQLLAERAFQDKVHSKKLNAITHPLIMRQVESQIQACKDAGLVAAVVDAALLFESGADALCDTTVAVTADVAIRICRITKRDNIGEDLAKMRISVQQPNEYYSTRVSYDMDGTLDLSQIPQKVEELYHAILREFPNTF